MKVSSIIAILFGKANKLDELIRRGGVPKKGVDPSGSYAHAEGSGTVASGKNSHAEGVDTIASGDYSHAEGSGTQATNANTHAEGTGTHATGNISHAEGVGSQASGTGSHAEGYATKAQASGAHSEGTGAIASGDSSHAEGVGTNAVASYSHVEGERNTAQTRGSHVEGAGNGADWEIADHAYVHVGGVNAAPPAAADRGEPFNVGGQKIRVGKYLEIVGNGRSAAARSNARTLDINGNEVLAGGLSIGGPLTVSGQQLTGSQIADLIALLGPQ